VKCWHVTRHYSLESCCAGSPCRSV